MDISVQTENNFIIQKLGTERTYFVILKVLYINGWPHREQ